jgi:uncharacterized membrane protein YhaH (DUF805 family)
MSFFDSIKTVFAKFAEFDGRATRPEYWWFALFNFLAVGALNSLNIYFSRSESILIGASLAGFWSFVVLLPYLAVTVRRLRDAGYRWVELFWLLLPIAGLIVLIVRLSEATAGATPAPAAAPAAAAPATAAPKTAPKTAPTAAPKTAAKKTPTQSL